MTLHKGCSFWFSRIMKQRTLNYQSRDLPNLIWVYFPEQWSWAIRPFFSFSYLQKGKMYLSKWEGVSVNWRVCRGRQAEDRRPSKARPRPLTPGCGVYWRTRPGTLPGWGPELHLCPAAVVYQSANSAMWRYDTDAFTHCWAAQFHLFSY